MTTATNAPFLDVARFEVEPETPPARPTNAPWPPFLSVYELDGSEPEVDEPIREAYATLVNELYDEEFDESLFELLSEARSLHDARLDNGHSSEDADRIVVQHFAQLSQESKAMLGGLAQELTAREGDFLVREGDEFAEHYDPRAVLQPSFEGFLRTLAKKTLKGLGKVASTVKNVAIGPVLAQIAKIVDPLLRQV